MGFDAVDQQGGGGGDDTAFLLTLTGELYDSHPFSDMDLDGVGEDDIEELVPLVELVSSEDALTSAMVLDLLPLDSDDGSVADRPSAQLQQTHQAQAFLGAGGEAQRSGISAASSASTGGNRVLTKKQHGVKKSFKQANPNKARDERKGELIYLRKKVSELEAQLSSVQAKRPRITTSATGSGSNGVMTSSCQTCQAAAQVPDRGQQQTQCRHTQTPVVVNVWQDIANRQSEERVKAERENIRLKLVLENQLKIAKSLEKILNKKSNTKDIEEFVERNHMCAPTADATDADVFNALLADVDRSYFEIDAVFEANGLAHLETPLSNARMRSDSTNGMFLEIFANKLLPFDMHATGSAVWHHFAFAKEHTPFRCYSYSSNKYMHSTEDTIVENFILKLDAKGTVGNFRVKQILRRHVEQDRVVVVWRAIIDPFEFSDEPVTGVCFRESGYIVIKRPSSIAGDHTLLQTCYIFTPKFTESVVGSDHPRVGAITDFVLTSTAANISSTHQMIENVLLEQAMKGNACVQSVH